MVLLTGNSLPQSCRVLAGLRNCGPGTGGTPGLELCRKLSRTRCAWSAFLSLSVSAICERASALSLAQTTLFLVLRAPISLSLLLVRAPLSNSGSLGKQALRPSFCFPCATEMAGLGSSLEHKLQFAWLVRCARLPVWCVKPTLPPHVSVLFLFVSCLKTDFAPSHTVNDNTELRVSSTSCAQSVFTLARAPSPLNFCVERAFPVLSGSTTVLVADHD